MFSTFARKENSNPYMMLAKVILPSEMTEYFDLVNVRTDEYGGESRLHLYLDEKDINQIEILCHLAGKDNLSQHHIGILVHCCSLCVQRY